MPWSVAAVLFHVLSQQSDISTEGGASNIIQKSVCLVALTVKSLTEFDQINRQTFIPKVRRACFPWHPTTSC